MYGYYVRLKEERERRNLPRHKHELSFKCWVCRQETLPSPNNWEPVADDPGRYKRCIVCCSMVPFSIRRTKSYRRRWDEESARHVDE